MDTNSFFHTCLCQSVDVFVVYPPYDDPHMFPSRGTCHYRTQLLGETRPIVKQNRVSGMCDVFHVRLHPPLLRPLYITLREGTYSLVVLVVIMKIMMFPDCSVCVVEQGLLPVNILKSTLCMIDLNTNCCRVTQSVVDERPCKGHEKHRPQGMTRFMIGKVSLNTPSTE